MKKYHVYGLGNALVDYEYEVEASFLKEMNIDKGLMLLVDEARQAEIVEKLHGLGHKRNCGGSAANTLIAVAQLGGKGFYSCKVANDETGKFYFSDLKKEGLETNLKDGSLEEGTSGKCLILITPDADRTMNTYLGISQGFSTEQLDEKSITESEYLYIEGYLVTSPTGKEAATAARDIARKNGTKVSLTLSDPGVVEYFKSGFEEIIDGGVDLLFCNEAEAMSFTGADNFEQATVKLKEITKSLAITRGAQGAYIWDGEKEIQVLAPEVKAIDTNGAGDLFAGSFLYGITNGMSFGEAGKLACACSSKLVTQFGARLSKDQIQEVYAKMH